MAVTIREIAQELNLSESTISRALNGFHALKPETIRRVQDTAKKLGYTPNLLARSLAGAKVNIIGLVLPSLDYPHGEFNSQLLQGIESSHTTFGYDLLFMPVDHVNRTGFLKHEFMQGLILLGLNHAQVRAIRKTVSLPMVVVDLKSKLSPSVFSDNYGGGYKAAEHLLSLGHRDILYLGGPRSYPSVRSRLSGFSAALKKAGVPVSEKNCIFVDWRQDIDEASKAISALLQAKTWHYTAIFAANDMLAIGAIHELQQQGFRVPQDVSVVGFDDISFCKVMRPTLTSIQQKPYEMGKYAVEFLNQMIKGEHEEMMYKAETKLIIRDSTAPPAKKVTT